jgi:hypothetical protein
VFRDIDCGLDHEFREGDSVYKRAPEVRAIPNIGEKFQMYEVAKGRLDVPLSHGPVEDDRQNSNNSKDDSSGPD